ncbi:hypothetical protein ABZ845_30815 [Streptomyces sp. NPDC047022]|uniref:hypothetical protein n=1 Tax=Streptomyces sp. NPDC047022 TaxID=3155737 RepID=UPI0034112F92
MTVYLFPFSGEEGSDLTRYEALEVANAAGFMVAETEALREHPEVPLTWARRDELLESIGYRRTGPWVPQGDDESRFQATVEPVPGHNSRP